jgi:transcriptional regulator with XRE-family HTH domain
VKTAFTASDAATPDASFRLFLQSELARRCHRNAMYSLRSFAHQLGVDASTLSQWLRGKRPLTARAIETLGAQLGLPADRIRAYVDDASRPSTGGLGSPLDQLTRETVTAIGDWYHLAILELVRLADFQPDSRWIARMLDITVDEVNVALQRLLRLELLEMRSPVEWADNIGDAGITVDALGLAALERLQQRMQRASVGAVRDVPLALRDHCSTTVAINSKMLPRAFQLVTAFRQQLLQLLQEGTADDVYQIEVALFPLTTRARDGRDARPGEEVTDGRSSH